jgi:superfamily II DNA or RNA helicase
MSTIKFDWDNGRRQGVVSGDLFDDIREHFSIKNEAATFARMRGRWASARKYAITPAGRFDIGMFNAIFQYITDNRPDVKVVCTDEFEKRLKPSLTVDTIPELKLKLRDYQQDIVNNCISRGRGTVVLATAGGKTLTIATLLEAIFRSNKKFKCALIVPDLGLVNQTFDDFDEYGVTFGFSKWTGSHDINLASNVIICNLGILQSDKSNTEWLNHVDVCVVDEVHKLRKGNKINKLLKTVRTDNRFGLTGTMPEDKVDQWNIIGKIGPVIYERNSAQLRKDNYISDVKVQVLQLEYEGRPNYPTQISTPVERYRVETEFIAYNKFRNNVLSSLCSRFDNNALILVDYIDHGKTLHRHLQAHCPDKKVYFIRGEVDVEDRDKVKQIMEQEDNVVVVAISKIFSTGINIKNLHYIVFGSGGKAKIKTIQSIGRGLRLHKNKSKLIIFDIGDMLQYGAQHLKKRIQWYKKEQIEYGIQKISEKSR